MAWIKVEYWTPEETREIVGCVDSIEKDLLEKVDSQFVKLENVRWIEVMEIDDDLLDELSELELDLDDLPEEIKEELQQIEEDIDEDEDDDDDFEDDMLDEVIVRLEDDFDFGSSSVLYIKREHILVFSPVREDYIEYWDSTVGTDD